MKFETLLSKIDNAHDLDFGTILGASIELFKKVWVQGLILMLLVLVALVPFFLWVYVPLFRELMEQAQSGAYDRTGASQLVKEMTKSMQYTILGITFVYTFFSTGLVSGFYKIVKKLDHDEPFVFGDFFYYFKGRYLGKLFAIAAFTLLLALLNLVFEKFLPAFSASLLKIGISLIFSVYSSLFLVFFAFNETLEISDIFVLSFKLGSRKWALLFGLIIVGLILGMLGALGCGIGMLFTFSIMYLPLYIVYKTLFGFDALTDIDKIGSDSI
jgi:hypothetical protein